MLNLAILGAEIAVTRKALGIRQTDLAKRSGVSRATIVALEGGRAGELGFNKLSRILAILRLEFRVGPMNNRRPTMEELMEQNAAVDPSLDRRG
jgi:transcriptional regulator with XRE-family HTH domain